MELIFDNSLVRDVVTGFIWNLLPGKFPVILRIFFFLTAPFTVPKPGVFGGAMVAEFTKATVCIVQWRSADHTFQIHLWVFYEVIVFLKIGAFDDYPLLISPLKEYIVMDLS